MWFPQGSTPPRSCLWVSEAGSEGGRSEARLNCLQAEPPKNPQSQPVPVDTFPGEHVFPSDTISHQRGVAWITEPPLYTPWHVPGSKGVACDPPASLCRGHGGVWDVSPWPRRPHGISAVRAFSSARAQARHTVEGQAVVQLAGQLVDASHHDKQRASHPALPAPMLLGLLVTFLF